MRIIAGKWRGRLLTAPAGRTTRPSADRLREALFSILYSRLGSFKGLRVADLFAGSGAFGFEALSRGTAHAAFVELDAAALRAIEANGRQLGCSHAMRLVRADARRLPATDAAVDILFADPPYNQNLLPAVWRSALEAGWIAHGTWIVAETSAEENPVVPEGCTIIDERKIGRGKLLLARYDA